MLSEQTQKTVVVVGASYAGTAFLQSLEKLLLKHPLPDSSVIKLVLVDRHDGRFHNIATPRALVDASVIEHTVLPYSRLFKHVEFIHDTVKSISKNTIVLQDEKQIPFDYAVMATGSENGVPGKFSHLHSQSDILQTLRELNEAVA